MSTPLSTLVLRLVCQNGGVYLTSTNECTCPPLYFGPTCSSVKTNCSANLLNGVQWPATPLGIVASQPCPYAGSMTRACCGSQIEGFVDHSGIACTPGLYGAWLTVSVDACSIPSISSILTSNTSATEATQLEMLETIQNMTIQSSGAIKSNDFVAIAATMADLVNTTGNASSLLVAETFFNRSINTIGALLEADDYILLDSAKKLQANSAKNTLPVLLETLFDISTQQTIMNNLTTEANKQISSQNQNLKINSRKIESNEALQSQQSSTPVEISEEVSFSSSTCYNAGIMYATAALIEKASIFPSNNVPSSPVVSVLAFNASGSRITDLGTGSVDIDIEVPLALTHGARSRLAYTIAWPLDLEESDIEDLYLDLNSRGQLVIMYRFVNTSQVLQVDADVACRWWNFARNEWSGDGCSASQVSGASVSSSRRRRGLEGFSVTARVTASHLTNFAVFVTRSSQSSSSSASSSSDDKVLTNISLIGGIISVICLVICVVAFRLIWKDSAMKMHHKILSHLCFALMVVQLTFLAQIDNTANSAGCLFGAAVLHYFLLVTFALQLCHAIDIYNSFIEILPTKNSIQTSKNKLFIASWTMPLVIVGIALASTQGSYVSSDYCWIDMNGVVAYSFVAPMGIMFVINLMVFVLAISKMGRRVGAWVTIRAAMLFFFLLGLTWGIGLIMIVQPSVALQYLFCILSVAQGVFIIVFYFLLNPKLRDALFRRLGLPTHMPLAYEEKDIEQKARVRHATEIVEVPNFDGEEIFVHGDQLKTLRNKIKREMRQLENQARTAARPHHIGSTDHEDPLLHPNPAPRAVRNLYEDMSEHRAMHNNEAPASTDGEDRPPSGPPSRPPPKPVMPGGGPVLKSSKSRYIASHFLDLGDDIVPGSSPFPKEHIV